MSDASPVTGHQTPDTALMSHIKARWGAEIAAACQYSTVPEMFLAALVANESGGNPDAKRFERHVLAALWEVLQGRQAAYGSLGAQDVRLHMLSGEKVTAMGFADAGLDSALKQLDELATSWGLTQIMGYESIVFQAPVAALVAPASGLRLSLRMISHFAAARDLDVTRDFPELFDCWNTGRPHAPTADPQYIPNGLARMRIYSELEPPKAISA